jgi:hypothetical protein
MIIDRIQSIVDRHVAGSPRARQLLGELAGRRMQIVARHTPWSVTLHSQDVRLLVGFGTEPADATLAGTPLALLALLLEAWFSRERGAASADGSTKSRTKRVTPSSRAA